MEYLWKTCLNSAKFKEILPMFYLQQSKIYKQNEYKTKYFLKKRKVNKSIKPQRYQKKLCTKIVLL